MKFTSLDPKLTCSIFAVVACGLTIGILLSAKPTEIYSEEKKKILWPQLITISTLVGIITGIGVFFYITKNRIIETKFGFTY